MSRGRFDVWAPVPTQVRLSVGDELVAMTKGADGWWTPDGPVPDGEVDYGYLLDGLVEELADAARSNSLALKLLALTIPGVPDVYQGSEVEERSL
ncbi:MAG: hypothetical protein ABWY19_10030, partial [Marmoricola sp.]